VLATACAGEQALPKPDVLRGRRLQLVKNTHRDRDGLLRQLQEAGYTREAQVQGRGQFSVRGAVVDIFSWDAQRPLRTEWEDEELISLREFDVDAQRSVQTLKTAEISLAGPGSTGNPDETSTLRDYLPGGFVTVDLGGSDSVPTPIEEQQESCPPQEFFAHDFLHAPRGDFILQENRRDLFLDHLRDWLAEGWEVAVFCNNEGEQKRLQEILADARIEPDAITFLLRPLLRGFVWPAGKLVVLSDAEIFGRYQTMRALRQQERLVGLRSQHQALDFTEIADGDYVVHLHHGIALYKGGTTLPGAEVGRRVPSRPTIESDGMGLPSLPHHPNTARQIITAAVAAWASVSASTMGNLLMSTPSLAARDFIATSGPIKVGSMRPAAAASTAPFIATSLNGHTTAVVMAGRALQRVMNLSNT